MKASAVVDAGRLIAAIADSGTPPQRTRPGRRGSGNADAMKEVGVGPPGVGGPPVLNGALSTCGGGVDRTNTGGVTGDTNIRGNHAGAGGGMPAAETGTRAAPAPRSAGRPGYLAA